VGRYTGPACAAGAPARCVREIPVPARTPGAGASRRRTRQAGLLALGSGGPVRLPAATRSGRWTVAWPITAAAPRRIRTGFPVRPSRSRLTRRGREPVECEWVYAGRTPRQGRGWDAWRFARETQSCRPLRARRRCSVA